MNIFSWLLLSCGWFIFQTFSVFADDNTMSFRVADNGGQCSQCMWIVAEGKVTKTTANDFERFIESAGSTPTRIIFDSPGGDLAGGLELGRKIRKLGFSTAIGKSRPSLDLPTDEELTQGLCASSCAFAFLGGVNRQVVERNRLGESGGDFLCTPI